MASVASQSNAQANLRRPFGETLLSKEEIVFKFKKIQFLKDPPPFPRCISAGQVNLESNIDVVIPGTDQL